MRQNLLDKYRDATPDIKYREWMHRKEATVFLRKPFTDYQIGTHKGKEAYYIFKGEFLKGAQHFNIKERKSCTLNFAITSFDEAMIKVSEKTEDIQPDDDIILTLQRTSKNALTILQIHQATA